MPSFFNFKNKIQPHVTKVSGFVPTSAPPDEALGDLFQDVQLRRVHADGKTFVDLVPRIRIKKIAKLYEQQRQNPNFHLQDFVKKYFDEHTFQIESAYKSDPNYKIEEHVDHLWRVLRRQTPRNRGSLMALPYPYVVPGGRFSEQFYWDSYFIMLGLASSGRFSDIEGMMKNYAYLIRKIGFIPTASRTYFLSRSQPPFFALMVRLLVEGKGKTQLIQYLPYLLAEYRFWMKGAKELSAEQPAVKRVVRMPNGTILNRYFDNKSTPRPESYREDVEIATQASSRTASRLYRDLRAGAESGWDYSSRWFKDGKHLTSINTTEAVPVDLNCLLAELEHTIADAYTLLRQRLLAKRYRVKAEKRIAAIQEYCWSKRDHYFFDYDFVAGKRTGRWTLAGVFPLYLNVANENQAHAAAKMLREKFLKKGGLVTTLENTGQQWDWPNGWAPLQWAAIVGLRNYGEHELASEIKKRWIKTVRDGYLEQGKLVEKYNVVHPGKAGGGGEYALQDGFGWTNGVLLALLDERDPCPTP